MKFRRRTLMELSDLVVGNSPANGESYFPYRSSSYITEFFEDLGTNYVHDGTTRNRWVADVIADILSQPGEIEDMPPQTFCRLIEQLMNPADALNEGPDRPNALSKLNMVLNREGLEVYCEAGRHTLRKIGANRLTSTSLNPYRPLTAEENKKRQKLDQYLDRCSEDELIGDVLIPLFKQLGFERIMEAGHSDKALEYGKDVWMRYILPTKHVLYFGLQAKRGKIDSSGRTKTGSANIAEIHNQAVMMLAHPIFDPELNRRVLVDHAFIVSGGKITKQARQWLGEALDASKRSQIIFMDRDDILNLYTVSEMALPTKAVKEDSLRSLDDPPF
ncbi:hypothetical protein IRY31_03775 [Corynebacterium afermentans subsp. lipophilum]|nr:hypothetical protein [Corynebacterium afermentans subsp. lipophilum]WJY59923.1 hypothetical protein CAFEL_10945 [Corynebacterium afermentans subsp. lipophilum]